ncbi:MucR family transcriptional regulator [Cryptosporangium japonicum]|uniref:MucR family transcriptional regulator n=1 Tax=Cryptosporangium japonicum TaxID=80872 RepID=A0ABP3D508_9ACTN
MLYAPHDVLVRDPLTGRVRCHLCGDYFAALGAHVRRHGLNAAQYREATGLEKTRPLTSAEYSQQRSDLQRLTYQRSPATRARLATGQQMARTGELNHRAVTALSTRLPVLQNAQRTRLDAGRTTRSRRVRERARRAAEQLGYHDLDSCLRALYVDQHLGLEPLSHRLGVGRAVLRNLLTEAGIPLHATGDTGAAGRRARAVRNEADAAARVGTTDLATWLAARRAQGATMAELAAELGRSLPWVRQRLGVQSGVG